MAGYHRQDEEERKESQRLAKELVKVAAMYLPIAQKITDEDMKLIIPSTNADFVNVGNKLAICVGSNNYDQKMAKRKCLIVFVYKNNEPLECCELVNEAHHLKINQLRGKHNQPSKYHEKAEELVNQFIQSCHKTKTLSSVGA